MEVGLVPGGDQCWAESWRPCGMYGNQKQNKEILWLSQGQSHSRMLPCVMALCLHWDADTALEWIVVQPNCDGAPVRNFLTAVSWSWGTHFSASSCQVRGNWCHGRFCDVRTHLGLLGTGCFNCCLSISHWKEPAILLPHWEPLKTDRLGCTKDWHSSLQSFEPFLCLCRWKQQHTCFDSLKLRSQGASNTEIARFFCKTQQSEVQ